MATKIEFNSILVPVDFSASSKVAFDRAAAMADGDNGVVIVLHVIDPALIDFAAEHGFGLPDQVADEMRERAARQLEEFKQRAPDNVEVDALVSQGVPFLEILQKAKDFAVDLIVMAKVGSRGQVQKLLFGSTAEMVLRGSSCPVLALPIDG